MQRQILFLGAPGVGKGTFARRVAPALSFTHLSAGDILREEVKNKTDIGKSAESYLSRGSLVSSSLIIELMRQKVALAAAHGVILDGFPRQREQAEVWATKPDLVVNIKLNQDVLLTKLTSRRVCPSCGENYNLADINFPPYDMPALLPKVPDVCDVCGSSPLVQRDDDKPDVVRHRLALHAELEEPLIGFYRDAGVHVVDFTVLRGVKQTQELIDLVKTCLKTSRVSG